MATVLRLMLSSLIFAVRRFNTWYAWAMLFREAHNLLRRCTVCVIFTVQW